MQIEAEKYMTHLNIAKPEAGSLTLFQIAALVEIPGFPRFTRPALARRKEAGELKIKSRKTDDTKTQAHFFSVNSSGSKTGHVAVI